jgi:hypothetical protein
MPAQFTLAEDGNRTYDLSGQAGPLMEIMQILKASGVPMNGTIDIRSNPAVRQQVMSVVRRAAAQQVPPAAHMWAPPVDPAAAYVPPPMPAPAGTGDVARHGHHLRRRVHRQAAADHLRPLIGPIRK